MVNPGKKSTLHAGIPSDHDGQGIDKVLLKALHDFIVPHIGNDAHLNSKKDVFSGPKAKNLITALRAFISSVVESPSSSDMEAETTIAVSLDTDRNSASTKRIITVSRRTEDANAKQSASGSTFHAKVLQELQRHVFNKMPIRLLRFVPKGPLLEISLIERSVVYKHLISILQERQNDDDYRPISRKGGSFWESLDLIDYPRLETEEQAIERLIIEHCGYAILSHAWLRTSSEVTYGDWKSGVFDTQSPGYQKLVNFCKVAWKNHGLTLGWMDTICINKDSSSELDESIRSMYNWYNRSKICVIYLAETETLRTMHCDSWFSRGWTLQELLAPNVLKSYNQHWEALVGAENDKMDKSITDQIKKATSMEKMELLNILSQPLSRRMQLAAPRKVTREEDSAYSLMGLFDVSIATAYGEGAKRAFYRLIQEILNTKSLGVLDLFNWAGEGDYTSTSKILPPSTQRYLARASAIFLDSEPPIEPLTLTHMGVRIPVLLMPGISTQNHNRHFQPRGKYSAVVSIALLEDYKEFPTTYHLLDRRVSGSDSDPDEDLDGEDRSAPWQLTFAVFNITQDRNNICIPWNCIAITLSCKEEAGKVSSSGAFSLISTVEPVTFNMLQRNPNQGNSLAKDYMLSKKKHIYLPREDLAKHGIQLVFKYL